MKKQTATALSFAALLSIAAAAPALAQAPTSSLTESAAPATGAASQPQARPAASPAASPPAAAPGASTGAVQNLSDAQLQKFVASAQEVAVLSQKYSQQLKGVTDKAGQQQVVEQANQEMAKTVQSHGLSVQEFNAISDAVDRDPALQQRAQQFVK